MIKKSKIACVFAILLILLITIYSFLTFSSKKYAIAATNIEEIDETKATEYEVGQEAKITYKYSDSEEIYNDGALIKLVVDKDSTYDFSISDIVDDKDTYVDMKVFDKSLKEYGSISSCEWNANDEEVTYHTSIDHQIDLISNTYYVLISVSSHSDNSEYSGSFDFSISKKSEIDIVKLEPTISDTVDVTAGNTTFRSIVPNKTGWYEISSNLTDEETDDENEYSDISLYSLNVSDTDNNTCPLIDGMVYLEKDKPYTLGIALNDKEIIADVTKSIEIKLDSIEINSLSKDTKFEYTNEGTATYTADKKENVIFYSVSSSSANPNIKVIEDENEIAGNDNYSYNSSNNKLDFGVVTSVEKNRTYTLLVGDSNESGETIEVYAKEYDEALPTPDSDADEPTLAPTMKPTRPPIEKPTLTPDIYNISGIGSTPQTQMVLKSQKITTAKIKTYKASKLKKKSITFNLKAKTSGDGKLTYKVTNGKSKYIKVTKKGKVTLKKKCKKGTYKIRITASKTAKYYAVSKVVKIKVK